MTTLVTGAAGYLGSYVVDTLLERGDTVVGLDNLAWGKSEHIDRLADVDHFRFAKADITDTGAVADAIAINGVDEVIHLAALHFIPAAVKDPTLAVRINVLGTQSILDAARQAGGVQRLSFASTGDVYAPSDVAHHESAEIGPFNIYGLTKLQGEQLIALDQRRTETTYLVARFFNLYGARETNPHIVPEIVDQLRDGSPALRLGNLEPRRDMVPVDEAARALVEAGRQATAGQVTTVNIGTGTAHRMADLVATLVAEAGTQTAVETDPDKVRASERMHLQADVAALTSMLGWAPSDDLSAGVRRLMVAEGLRPTT